MLFWVLRMIGIRQMLEEEILQSGTINLSREGQ